MDDQCGMILQVGEAAKKTSKKGKELGDLVGLNFFKHQFSLQY